MRVFLYECKKILNIKLLLLLAVFTWFYVQTYYVQIVGFPGIVPGADGITYISKPLRDKVGTTLNKSEFYLLDEILEDMLRDKNKLIQESEILAVEGITDSVQMDEVREEYYLRMDQGDEHARQVIAEMDRIIFLDGPLENRVEDQIRALYEELEAEKPGCVNFLCDSREEALESAKEALFWDGGNENPDPVMVEYLANFFENDELSLLPEWLLTVAQTTFPSLGTVMLLSCAILILPWQIRERLSGVRELQGCSVTGRRLWDRQLLASLASAALMCMFQTAAYVAAMHSSDITYYWNYPTYGLSGTMVVIFPFTYGQLILFRAGLITLYTLACVVLFHLISKTAGNYVVGYAMVIAPFLLLNWIGEKLFVRMYILSRLWDTIWPYLAVLGMIALAAAIAGVQAWIHRRRDVA